ncbi:MAG: ribonuclease Y [Candidatus Aerophobetes bacterium]|nr:ribonuclease Y [Candidatus Aerophobetes bacterium]
MASLNLIYILAGILVGGLIIALVDKIRAHSLLSKARYKLSQVEEEIRNRKREFELEKKEELHRIKDDFERETKEKRDELHKLSKRLIEREEALEYRLQELERKERKVSFKERELEDARKSLRDLEVKERQKLERVSGMSAQEAKESLLENVRKEAKEEAVRIIQEAETEAKETANKKARGIIATAIQRCGVDHISESVVSVVSLPNDQMKGRVIGREGRNIRTFEALTGVDLIVDDTPEAVVISCFDPLRRKIAEISLERLIADTRIHPARIEEVVEKVKKGIEEVVQEEGQQVTFDIGISDLAPELIKLLGKLKFRTSYGQNVLEHSKEVAYIASIMAAEIGADCLKAKRAGLLHDIGKAADRELEGPHALIGAHLARQYGESPEIIHAIASHHEDRPAETTLAILIQASDAISAARPGARKEVLEAYIKRLENLEKIANAFSGVDKAYAIQAGREIRIIVQPHEINDEMAVELSRKTANKIKGELSYPGQIKVTVIREFRSVEYAK